MYMAQAYRVEIQGECHQKNANNWKIEKEENEAKGTREKFKVDVQEHVRT